MKKILSIILLLSSCFLQTNAQLRANDEPFDILNGRWENTMETGSMIKSTRSGGIDFSNVPGAYKDIRIFQKLGFAAENSFAIGFYFTVSDVSNTGAALLPMVLTAGNAAPSNPSNQPAVQTNQNALGILFQTPLNNKKSLQISPYLKVGATPQTALYDKFIRLEYNKSYFIQLKRCNGTNGNLTVKLKNEIVGSVDFIIPNNIGNLSYLQAANMVQASQYRNCSAKAALFTYNPERLMNCGTISTPVDPIKTPVENPVSFNGILDYEDFTNKQYSKPGSGCCQLMQVQYGEFKNGYITEGAKIFNPIAPGDCYDVLSINRSIVFPGRRTIVYSDNTNKRNTLDFPDTGVVHFNVYKNKVLTNTVTLKTRNRYNHSITEDFVQIVNGKAQKILTNKYTYNKIGDDFPATCMSYKNDDSSKYLKISYFSKKRNITSFTVFNSETNNTVTYTVLKDKDKYSRFSRMSPLHYYIGLQTPENPNPIFNLFAFGGDLITDLVPDKEIDGATKIHFDYTFVKNANSHLASMRGTNGTNLVFDYDCNYSKPEKIVPSPPEVKEPPKEVKQVEPPVDPVKKPKYVMDPKDMKKPNTPTEVKKPIDVKKPITKDSIPITIPPAKSKG